MKEYIKPEIMVIDLKASGLMENIVVTGSEIKPGPGDENSGQMSKGETMFNWEDYHYSAWETWDE